MLVFIPPVAGVQWSACGSRETQSEPQTGHEGIASDALVSVVCCGILR